jgi:hypothetical protein
MEEPSIRASRLAIAGGLGAAIVLGAAGFVIGRTTAPRPEPPAAAVATEVVPVPPAAGDSVLRRADLIELAEDAADALTSGKELDEVAGASPGQRFELVLPFGCSGPNESGPAMRWHYDPASETLRITVEPNTWNPDQWGLGPPAAFEVAEGFWISRSWSSSEACPQGGAAAAPPDTDAITLPGQTLAIAQFFAAGASRDARRDGRRYESVTRVPAKSFDAPRGFLLRVKGRIDEIPGGGVVRCAQPAGVEQRPLCVIGARMDEVAIENPAGGDVVASWRVETAG